jgi:cell division septation protein DedD
LAACTGGGGAASGGALPNGTLAAARAIAPQAATNVIQDPGFEDDDYTYWKQGGTVSAQIETSVVYAGSYAAKMGGTTTEPNGTEGVYQTVTIPTGGVLTFELEELTNETSTTYADQEADIRSTSGTILKNLYKETVNTGTWGSRSYDVSAYAGQTVEIYFGVTASGTSGYHIVQYIDSVSLTGSGTATATPSASPTATATATSTATATAKPTATATATAKPTATPTATAKPTATPTAAPTSASGLTVVSETTAMAAIAAGKNVSVSSYTLTSGGDLQNALITAAKAGGKVNIDLPSDSYAQSIGVYADDEAAAKPVIAAGGTVTWDAGTQTPNAEPLHAKFAIVDGVGYLDGRNWDSGDVILKDTNANDLTAMASALALNPTDGTRLDTVKQDSLSMETSYLTAHTSGEIDFMTESFGQSNVSDALLAAAKAGQTVKVIVLKSDLGSGEETVLANLQAAGALVYTNSASGSEKISINGSTAWFGSSNATTGAAYQIDWGMDITDASVISALKSNFATVLSSATVYSGS